MVKSKAPKPMVKGYVLTYTAWDGTLQVKRNDFTWFHAQSMRSQFTSEGMEKKKAKRLVEAWTRLAKGKLTYTLA